MQHKSAISIVLSAELCRPTREMTNVSMEDLAFVAGVPRAALEAFEAMGGEVHPDIALRLRRALDRAGVKFVCLAGVLSALEQKPHSGPDLSESVLAELLGATRLERRP